MRQNKASRRPPIHMIDTEADTLTDLALGAQDRLPQVSQLLLQEIGRAAIHTVDKVPGDIVTMHSHVEFVDEASGKRRAIQLVYPKNADIASDRISIMTPIGAGLIGLREGQSIRWPDRNGHERALVIVHVNQRDKRSAPSEVRR